MARKLHPQQNRGKEAPAPAPTGCEPRRVGSHEDQKSMLETQNESLLEARDDLEKRLEQYRSLYDLAPVGYVVLDHNGTIQRANLTFVSMTGLPRTDALRRRFAFFFDEADRTDVLRLLQCCKRGTSGSVEVRLLRKYRDNLWVKLSAEPQMLPHVGMVECRCVLTDIQSSRMMVENQQRLELAQRAANSGIFDWDVASGRIIWTPQMEQILGILPGRFDGKLQSWLAVMPPEDAKAMNEWFKRWIESGPLEQSCEYRAIVGGQVRWMECRGRRIHQADDSAVHLVGINTDITARKNAQIEMQRLTGDLERSNRELEQFAYVASHDLKEPLRMVSGFLGLLEKRARECLDKEGREFISFAIDGADRMQRLIEDLLAFSRVGSGAREMELTDSNVAFDQAIRHLQSQIQQSQAKITRDDLPLLVADRGQLVQLFQNLLANAIKFRKKDLPPVIRVSAQRQENRWQFSVSDNGIGIDPAEAQRIFLIFQRLHAREEYAGSGIGLAICKKIVERHGGKIWFEANSAGGTTFFFTWPT